MELESVVQLCACGLQLYSPSRCLLRYHAQRLHQHYHRELVLALLKAAARVEAPKAALASSASVLHDVPARLAQAFLRATL